MDLLMNLIQLHLIVVMVLVYHNLIMFLSIDLSQVNIGPERLIVRPPNHMADLVYLSLSCRNVIDWLRVLIWKFLRERDRCWIVMIKVNSTACYIYMNRESSRLESKMVCVYIYLYKLVLNVLHADMYVWGWDSIIIVASWMIIESLNSVVLSCQLHSYGESCGLRWSYNKRVRSMNSL